MRRTTTLVAAVLLGFAAFVAFALDYPPLTGRVVDQANVITAQSRTEIETKLKELEDKSSIQLVVATVKSLQGKTPLFFCAWPSFQNSRLQNFTVGGFSEPSLAVKSAIGFSPENAVLAQMTVGKVRSAVL